VSYFNHPAPGSTGWIAFFLLNFFATRLDMRDITMVNVELISSQFSAHLD
jgi:hypothetical protein